MLDATEEGYVTADGRKIGGVLMEMKNITLRFGGVVAIKDISFDIREGEIRSDVPARLIRHSILGSIEQVCLSGITFDKEIDPDELTDQICEVIFRGIALI